MRVIPALLVALPLAFAAQTRSSSLVERRARIVAIAESYASHRWTAGPSNVLHGEHQDGVRVDTPDSGHVEGGFTTDGGVNVGVPYQWGGFSSLDEFDAGVRAGRWAGHAPASATSNASYRAVGVDCSGL